MGQKPECVLCPNKGGAMKSTRSGQKWAHVSCALWIPEVSIGSVDRMEPITKISSIPQSRWALVCVLCRERVGACIQCSVKTCKTAYHVTCAFQHGLEMRAIIEDENAEDGVKLRSYCQKHSVKKEPKNSANAEKASSLVSEDEGKVVTNKKKVRKEMTTEERNHARLARLVEIQSEFDKHVSVKDISCHLLDVDQEGINHIYNYWILKRKAGGNDPLLLPKAGDVDVMSQTDQEQADIEKMKMFVHLRQDLERVRNLCYMVSRREKLSRSFFKIREQIFHKQVSALGGFKKSSKQDEESIRSTMEANHAPSIYDVLYSSDSIKDSKILKIDEMIDSILGNNSVKSKEVNGNLKKEKQDAISRYSKLFNGGNISSSSGANKKPNNIYDSLSSDSDSSRRPSTRRRSHMSSLSASSASSSADESPARKSPAKIKASLPLPPQPVTPSSQPKKKGRPPGSTKQAVAEKRKQLNAIGAKGNKKYLSIESSSEEDIKHETKSKLKSPTIPRNRLPTDDVHLTDESDELVPITNSSGHSIPTTGNAKRILPSAIYSDSDSSSTDKDNKTDHTVSDSQQQPFRTKAAMKEFNINDLLAFDKSKKITDAPESKKTIAPAKKSPTVLPATKKVSPPRKDSKALQIKARRMSTKPSTTLTSDSEVDAEVETVPNNIKEKKGSVNQKKEILPDFLVVPQREAAKKASENLMKTNSALMVQSISGTASERNRREVREKLDETVLSSKILSEVVERDIVPKDLKEVKTKTSKPPKDSKKSISKDEKVEPKRPAKEEKVVAEKEEKQQSDFAADFLPYVPQRQAAKKAAEHIKGLGNASQPTAVQAAIVEEKSKPPTPTTKKIATERRKSIAVDLSSSSTSSSSSGSSTGSSSDSDSEKESSKAPPKQPITKASTKSMPSRRPSTAVGPKQKPKDSPFLDKVAKSSVTVKSSSSSSSSDSDSSSSDRPDPSRLPEKGNSSKRKPSDKSQTKKPIANSSKRPPVSVKKEIDKQPARRLSTLAKTLPSPSSTKTSTSNRSPQKPASESTTTPEPTISSRKRSTSSTSPPKLPSNNKPRTVEPSKGDLVKLSDKRKPSSDVKDKEMNPPPTKDLKKRKTSITSPVKEPTKKELEKNKVVNLRRSSRSETLSKASNDKATDTTKVSDNEEENNKAPEILVEKEDNFASNQNEKSPLLTKKSSDAVDTRDHSEKDVSKSIHEISSKESSKPNSMKSDIEKPAVNMDVDEDLLKTKSIIENNIHSSNEVVTKVATPLSSPMVSIPTANLDHIKPTHNEPIEEVFNKVVHEDNIFKAANSIFSIPKVTDKEAEERETMSLIEKLRKKDKKTCNTPASNIAENNNVVNEKMNDKLLPCMHQNENKNTPKNDFLEQSQQQPPMQPQISTFKAVGSPSIGISKKDQDFNELKKTSLWNQQNQTAENNYQRSILTSNNNKINSTLDQSPTPTSCMVIEQQQKLAAVQKINEENNMFSSNRGPNMFMPPLGINLHSEPQNHMDQFYAMQMQQQQPSPKWPKDPKSINLKMQQDMMKQRNLSGMENMNMINDLNQQAIKNSFPQMPQHKGPMTNDFSSAMHPHPMLENFNSYNFSENTSQNSFTGAVSLFPPTDMNVQVPFPSPGQAMFAPNFNNSFTNTPHQSSDPSMMMPGDLQNKVNNSDMIPNNLRFGAQNFCNPTAMQLPHSIPSTVNNINHLQMNRNVADTANELPSNSEKAESHKKSPSKSTRSSPRNSTPTHGGKTPQKSPSKSPRQPSTPASVESLSRQNSQKGKSTPNSNDTKQRKSRTNSQASPASTPSEHRGKGRGRTNKNNKSRFPQSNMPFIPFNSGIDYIAINKKLVGTVYDFSADDEFSQAPSVENLRAMRDRTKSVDVFNKLNRDGSSQSPKTTKASIKQSIQQSSLTISNHSLPGDANPLPVAPPIADLNLVNMPGPVDMRTYNSYDSTNDSTYNSQLLGAFASNTVDQTLNDIDEEQEKELQTALKASNDKQKTPTNVEIESTKSTIDISNIVEESVDSEASFAKVSLSDSRNQLKLKIKGPLAHPDLHIHANISPVVPQNVATSASNASSNRRQMRKKELLQQYWNQDMNIDQEQPNTQTVDHQTTSIISRIGGIPKAVDSMSGGLEEFPEFNYAEYKKRKRFVDLEMSNHSDISNEIDPLSLDFNKKRRNRTNRGGQQPNAISNPPPKLKIKIGSDVMETSGSDLPPKKRLIAAPPSYQDLKRESMNFRKKMMDEFSEQKSKEHRTKEEKREKKEKKKKKKEKKRSEAGPVKLILKIGNKSMSTVSNASADNSNSSELSKSAPLLKLKLSRNSQGNGEYNIMNTKIMTSTSTPKTSPNSMLTSTPISSNNNLQPPIIDASDINSITTKKLEISLERLEDIAKAKSLLKIPTVSNDKNSIVPAASKDCEGR